MTIVNSSKLHRGMRVKYRHPNECISLLSISSPLRSLSAKVQNSDVTFIVGLDTGHIYDYFTHSEELEIVVNFEI